MIQLLVHTDLGGISGDIPLLEGDVLLEGSWDQTLAGMVKDRSFTILKTSQSPIFKK